MTSIVGNDTRPHFRMTQRLRRSSLWLIDKLQFQELIDVHHDADCDTQAEKHLIYQIVGLHVG